MTKNELVHALSGLLEFVDRNTCEHDDTHRAGIIWTVCDGCGMKWADDEGGFVPHTDAPAVAHARAVLSAALEAEQPVAIPTNLVERCAEILEWKKTGLLPGNALRALGKKINDDFGGSHFIDNGLGQAELRTIDEAFHLILALSTRTADRAEQDGSAITTIGGDHG